MGDTTDDLIELAERVTDHAAGREMDMLLTAGERMSAALLAMAISDLGYKSQSYTGSQTRIITTAVHASPEGAKVLKVLPHRIKVALNDGVVPVVAGYQGTALRTKNITTLGRGGSDTTAVALAAALHADICEIYTDVDGVFTDDPRVVPTARKIPVISHSDMVEMSTTGAKVFHATAAKYAQSHKVTVHVRSSFSHLPGTVVTDYPDREIMLSATEFGRPSGIESSKAIVYGGTGR
jgi:aspartate kinase